MLLGKDHDAAVEIEVALLLLHALARLLDGADRTGAQTGTADLAVLIDTSHAILHLDGCIGAGIHTGFTTGADLLVDINAHVNYSSLKYLIGVRGSGLVQYEPLFPNP